MKTNHLLARCLLLLALATLNSQLSTTFAQGTAFTYQGRLNDGAGPATGLYDFQFAIYDDATAGVNQSTPVLVTLGVTNGLFTTTLNFGGNVFNGSARWLEINVRTNGAVDYATLAPRQPVTPAPYSIYAEAAGEVNAAAITGTLAPAQLPDGTLTNNAGGVTLAGSFTGSGGSLTNVNAATLNGTAAAGFWQLGGNTVAPGQFLGSANNQPVEIWAGGQRALRLEPTANDSHHSNLINVVGGSSVNFIAPGVYGSVIAGGGALNYYSPGTNSVSADLSFLGGGCNNSIQMGADYSFLGDGWNNSIQMDANHSFLGGGHQNSIQMDADCSFLGGGDENSIQPNASDSFLGGGYLNSIQTNAYHTFLGGGSWNSIQANSYDAILIGGFNNSIQPYADHSVLGGGEANTIQANADHSVLGGGWDNQVLANAPYSSLGGGVHNRVGGAGGTVPGGNGNGANGINSFAAGTQAKANHDGSFVLADLQYVDFASTAPNQLSARFTGGVRFVTGGAGLTVDGAPVLTSGGGSGLTIQTNADGAPNIIGGSPANYIASGVEGSTIAGGGVTFNNASNSVASWYSFLGGGQGNSIQANADLSFLGGGCANSIQEWSPYSFLGGGWGNAIQSGNYQSVLVGGIGNTIQTLAEVSFLGGGEQNSIQANAAGSFLGGGSDNAIQTNAVFSFLGGGNLNTNGAPYSVVPGGDRNFAGGANSFAAGHRAKANYAGDFVWADSQNADFVSTATNQFSVRAAGGAQFVTGGAGLTVDGPVSGTSGTGVAVFGQANSSGGWGGIFRYGSDGNNCVYLGGNGSAAAFYGPVTVNGAPVLTSGGGSGLTVQQSQYPGLGAPDIIGGSPGNWIAPGVYGATIAGGGATNINGNSYINSVSESFGSIGGGHNNTIQPLALSATIAGGAFNNIQTNAFDSTISGGASNAVNSVYSTIGGGGYNTIQTNADFSTIGGGNLNTNGAPYSLVPGGDRNFAGGANSFAAGHRAKANYAGDFVWADSQNADFVSTATNQFSVRAAGGAQFVTAGAGLTVDGAVQATAFIGGNANTLAAGLTDSGLGGGNHNSIQTAADHSFLGSGYQNSIQSNATCSVLGGGDWNSIQTNADHSFLGGGEGNSIQPYAHHSFLGGGLNSTIQANAWCATIGGGHANTIQTNAYDGTIGGGDLNTIETNAQESTISGGGGNRIQANAVDSTIGGGYANTNGASCSVVPGGDRNFAGGTNSFAAGHRAKALYQGDFIWADSQDVDFNSTATDQFLIRAQGGVGINKNNPSAALDVNGTVNAGAFTVGGAALTGSQWSSSGGNIYYSGGNVGIGLSGPGFPLDVNGRIQSRGSGTGFSAGLWLYDTDLSAAHPSRAFIGMDKAGYFGLWGDLGANWGMIMNVTNGYVGIGTGTPDALLTVNGTADKPGGGSWSTFSDARLKDVGAKFTHGLADLARIQPVHYHYKTDNPLHLPSQPEYVGVVAQQVQPAIPEAVQPSKAGYLTVNNDPIIWTMVNAIKELHQNLADGSQNSETRIQKLETENAELKAQNAALSARLQHIEQLLGQRLK